MSTMSEKPEVSADPSAARVLGMYAPIEWPDPQWQQGSSIEDTVESNSIERRIAPRVPLNQRVTVKFGADGNYEFTAVSHNISSSGIFLYAESNIEEGAQVEVMLSLPSQASLPISMKVAGKVVRVEKGVSGGVAIEFDRLVIEPDTIKVPQPECRAC